MHVNSLPHSEAYPLEDPAPKSRRSRPRIGADTFPWCYHVCMWHAGKIVRVEAIFFGYSDGQSAAGAHQGGYLGHWNPFLP